ncbi:MAG: KEOPS complex subunit Pcc1 [Candidatus Bathyarchaeota archaeon]|nr:KEOPS complex subunit Pcc1 [Candidatus Bathyarchaeota archaeon]
MNAFKAKITIPVKSAKHAKILAGSISPDNVPTPEGLKVKTWCEGKKILTYVECGKSFETFLSTLDDILASFQLAEKTLRGVTGCRKMLS